MLEAMKAITARQAGGPEELELTEVTTPQPGPGEVRIAVAAAGVNRADLLQRQGHYPPPAGVTEIIGLEAAGVVEAVGPDATSDTARPDTASPDTRGVGLPQPKADQPDPDLADAPGGTSFPRVGDQVVALLAGGGYAERVLAPVGQCAPLPDGLSLTQAAGIMETAATVVSNFDHIRVRAGETILIHGGTGGIGSFAIPYAKHLGLRVITTVGSPAKAALATRAGADLVIDYHEDWAAQVRAATEGAGVDAILDIIGAKYLDANLRSLARGGRMTVIGLQGGTKATLDLNRLLGKAATITATSLRFRPLAEKAAIVRRVVDQVWPLFASGAIPLPPLTTFPLAEAGAAHALLESGRNVGKIVLTVGEGER